MGKAAQGLSPEEAMQKKETLLKAFGMAELDDSGNLIYDTIPEVDAAGKAVLDENGQLKKAVTPRLSSNISQFFSYLKNVFHGDLGLSYSQYPKPVLEIIKESLPWTCSSSSRLLFSAGFLETFSVRSQPTSAAFLTRSSSRWQCS